MQFVHVLGLLFGVFYSARAACMHPPLAPGYTNEKYSGDWYEIGRIQTAGGAYWQQNCVCDTASFYNFTSPVTGDGEVTYNCRNRTIDGDSIPVSGQLIAGEQAGNFRQVLFAAVDYNVIWLDDDTAMEYDCGRPLFTDEYCVHFLSRKPTLDPLKFEAMLNYSIELGLNTQNVPYKATIQEACW